VARYTKEIVKAGVKYGLPNGTSVSYSVEDLTKLVQNTKGLMASGYRVPAPWEHNRDITLSTGFNLKKGKVTIGPNGLLDDPQKNAGYWEDLYVKDGSLYGVLEVGNPDIQKKIGNEVRDVSLYARENYKDPLGNEHGNVLMHVCLTGKPIAMGTSNFEAQEVCLSQTMLSDPQNDREVPGDGPDQGPATDLGKLIKELERVGLKLPDSTTMDNLVNNLLVASMNYQEEPETPAPQLPGKSPKEEEKDIDVPPEGSKKKADKSVGGVFMSQDVESMKAEIEALKKDRDEAKANQEVLLSQVSQSKLMTAQGRIAALVNKKAMSQEEANAIFNPLMSEKTAAGNVMLSQKNEVELERTLAACEIIAKNISAHGKSPEELLLSQWAPQGSVGLANPSDRKAADDAQVAEFRQLAGWTK
jgi:hypothetical protein